MRSGKICIITLSKHVQVDTYFDFQVATSRSDHLVRKMEVFLPCIVSDVGIF